MKNLWLNLIIYLEGGRKPLHYRMKKTLIIRLITKNELNLDVPVELGRIKLK